MHNQQKISWGKLALLMFVVGLSLACNLLARNRYVQEVVPAEQEPAIWYLSPVGDKLLYDTTSNREQAIVHFLATGHEVTITNCPRFIWLDNERIYCHDFQDHQYVPFGVIDQVSSEVDTFQRTVIKEVTPAQVDLEPLLNRAKVIYRLSPSSGGPHPLLGLDTEPQKNTNQYYHVTGVKNLDKALEDYPYTTISIAYRTAELSKKVYSPNKKYYYLLQDNLGIYDAIDDQLFRSLPNDIMLTFT